MPKVIDPLIATEDRRFYQHRGMNLKGTASGLFQTAQGQFAERLDNHAAIDPRLYPD